MQDDSGPQVHWIRRCSDAACVEVALDRTEILMRNSEETDGPVLRFTCGQWSSFTAAVAAGEFDRD